MTKPDIKIGTLFLKGPLPLEWINQACQSQGRAIDVGLAIWFLTYMKRKQPITLNQRTLDHFALNRHAGYRGLKGLEENGLVEVKRAPGKSARVFLRKIPARYLEVYGKVRYEVE